MPVLVITKNKEKLKQIRNRTYILPLICSISLFWKVHVAVNQLKKK